MSTAGTAKRSRRGVRGHHCPKDARPARTAGARSSTAVAGERRTIAIAPTTELAMTMVMVFRGSADAASPKSMVLQKSRAMFAALIIPEGRRGSRNVSVQYTCMNDVSDEER
jgi:hypothetical protein